MKRMFYVCGFVIFGLHVASMLGISGITGITHVTGAEGFSGFTEATIALSADGTTLAEGGSVDEPEQHSYDINRLEYLCKIIHSNIDVIGKFLFNEQEGLATESVLKNKEAFSFYYDINDKTISNAITEFDHNLIRLKYIGIPCVEHAKPSFSGFGSFSGTSYVDFDSKSYDIFPAKHSVDEAYERLTKWFASIVSWCKFLTSADCTIESNQAIMAFMRDQIIFNADGALAEFKKAYETFIAVVNKSFEPKPES